MGDIAPDVEGFVELWTFYSSSGSRAAVQLKIDGERSPYCLSYTAVLVTFFPFASVPVVVTVRLLPSAETAMRPVIVVFPPFFTLTPNVRSSIFVSDRASEFGSPVTG